MLVTIIGLLAITANLVQGNVVPPKNEVESRIVDNNFVDIKQVPYQVSVRYTGIHILVGTIISKRVVITDNYQWFYFNNASDYSISYGFSGFGGTENVITAQRIVPYTSTYKAGYNYENVLILLESDIPFSEVARPIAVASVAPAVDTYANVTGWGLFDQNAVYLHQDSVQIADRSVCQGYYPNLVQINENLLCAVIRRNGTDVCAYTGGSSLVSNGELLGTSAIGIGCGPVYYYGLFTNIAFYKTWIDSYVNAEL